MSTLVGPPSVSHASMLGAGGPADGLVGQRITAGPDNITVLIIAAPDANIQEITSRAETVADHLNRLKAADPVMVLDQPGFPRTFIPPDYQLGVVQAVTDLMGGGLSTIRKGTAPLGTKASSTVGRGRTLARDHMPLSNLLAAGGKGGRGKGGGRGKRGVKRGENGAEDGVALPAAKRRRERLLPFNFGPEELADLAVALRAYVNQKRDTSAPVTSWSNLIARKWPREYAMAKQAKGLKCSAQKVHEAINNNLLNSSYQEA